MTRPEVITLLADMTGRWPHVDLSPAAVVDRYVEDLEHVQAAHAAAAAVTWHRDGERFPPSSAQVIGRIAQLALDIPDWGIVKAALTTPPATGTAPDDWPCPDRECDDRGWVADPDTNSARPCRCMPVRRQRARALRSSRPDVLAHPVVAEFLTTIGRAELRDLDDRTAEAQIRNKYTAFVRDISREITYQGVNPAGLPGVNRVLERAKARTNKTLAKPDMLTLLEGGGA